MRTKKKVPKQQQKRDAAQQETIQNQKIKARNESLDLLDSIGAQVSLDRTGHVKIGNAVSTLRVALMELEQFEKGIKQEEEDV